MLSIPKLFVAAVPALYAQSDIREVNLPNLESAGRVEITNVPLVSYINFPGLRTIEDCPGIEYPLEPALAANNRGLQLEKKADQYKDKGEIGQAQKYYEDALTEFLKADEAQDALPCVEIDVFRKNGERIQVKLKKLPNQEL